MYTIESETISLRDYFAAKAMQGLLASVEYGSAFREEIISQIAFRQADAMLDERDIKMWGREMDRKISGEE